MIHVRLQLFAVARQALGCDALELELPEGATVGDLRRKLAAHAPKLATAVQHFTFAVDQEYADDSTSLDGGIEFACIPPVSGG